MKARAPFVPLVSDFETHYAGQVADWLLAELADFYHLAGRRLLALDTERTARLAVPLHDVLTDAQSEAAEAVSAEFAACVANAVRVARSTSQFDVASPGDIQPALLRAMLNPDDWPDSALYAVLTMTAAIMAAELPALSRTYLGAAREAQALAVAADTRDALEAPARAKREERRARVAEFARLYKEIRPSSRGEKEALLEIAERMDGAGRSTLEGYKRDALAAGLL